MPIARMELPDGRIGRFEVPEGTTPEQAQAQIQEQFDSGAFGDKPPPPTERPNILERAGGAIADVGSGISEAFTGAERTTPELEDLNAAKFKEFEDLSVLNRARAAFRGEIPTAPGEVGSAPELNDFTSARSLLAGAKSLLATSQKDLEGILSDSFGDDIDFRNDAKGNIIAILPSGEYPLNKPGFSFQDVPELIAQGAAFTPGGRLARGGVALQTVKSAGSGVAAATALDKAEELAGGGKFDIKEPLIAGLLGGAFKAAEGVIGGGFRALRGKSDNEIVAAGEAAGIPVLTSDVFRPESFASQAARTVGEQIPITGTAGVRRAQQTARKDAIQDIAERYSSFSYDAIVESLVKGANIHRRAAGQRFEVFGNKLDALGTMPILGTNRAIAKAQKVLDKPSIKKSSAGQDLKNVVDFLAEVPQTYKSIMEGRTQLNEIIETTDTALRSQLGTRGAAQLKMVAAAMKKDMKRFAARNLTPIENRKLNRAFAVYAEEAKILTKSRVKNVLDKGDITPERVRDLLFSKNRSEVKAVFDRLTTSGKENARVAMIQETFKKITGAGGEISPERFVNEMRRNSDAINILFRGDEKKRLNGLIKVLDNTREASKAVLTTPTGQQLIAPLAIAGAGATAIGPASIGPIASLASVGLLARVYESKPVRDALIRLNSLKRGTTAFERNAKVITDALSVVGQTLAREE